MRSPSDSLSKDIKKEKKILNLKNAPKISQNRKNFVINISEIYTLLYKENFPLILKKTRYIFLEKIFKEAEEIILKGSLKSSNNIAQILESKEAIIKKYEHDFKLLSLEYKNYLKNKKNYKYFSHFRKHCGKTDKYGYHFCDSNKKAKFIEIKEKEEISYVICEGCKLCYKTDFIEMFCANCNHKYFSNKLKETENENILPATWGRYHCNSLINEIMKCIKCKNILYLNLQTGFLICLNRKCNFTSKPEDIIWKCITCGIEFTSYAKVYNPLHFKLLNNSIKFAMIKQIKAAPKKLPCGCSKDPSKLIFYHKEECKGELLKGILLDKNIIVCNKCLAINFEEKFNWICPLCGIKFHLHNVLGTKPFVKKKYIINKSFNRSLRMNESKYFLIKNLKNLNNINKNEDLLNNTTNISQNISGNSTIINSNIINFKNNLSPINRTSLPFPNNNRIPIIYDYNKKNEITNIKGNRYNSNSNPKKKKYRTLLDILKKREVSNNKTNEKNELNQTMTPSNNNNLLKVIQIPKKKNNFFNNSNKKKENLSNKTEYIQLNINKSNKQNIVENKETYKGALDTTDNSTFKTSSNNEPNKNIHIYKSIHNENNNLYLINNYKAYDSRRRINTNDNNNSNYFNLYKKNSNKLKLLKLNENNSKQNILDDIINLRNSININTNKYKNSFLGISYLNEDNKNDITYNKLDNSPNNNKENNINAIINSDKKPLQSDENNNNKEKNNSLDEEEQKDVIKDLIIHSSSKKIFRESLILHGNLIGHNILISQEKLNDLANKTNIPSFNENDYNYINPIGEGTYGTVYLVEHYETLEHYALKKIICRDYIELIKQKEELELLFSVKHKNILSLYGIKFNYLDETTSSILVLMELAKSDWNKEIKKRFLAKKYYKEKEIINILKQIIKGFLFLQDKNIAHRDIKPQNILLFQNNIYKISDFGEAKFIKNIKEQSTLKGSELFMSPLLYKGYKYNQKNVCHNPFKSDVFSLGYCLLYSMCLNLNALDALRELTTMKSIINCINKFLIPNTFSQKLINLLYKMIEPNEDLRYDFEDLSNELSNF